MRLAVPLEHVQAGPASWNGSSPRAQRLDPLRHHVAHDHLVPELGEAAAGDEARPSPRRRRRSSAIPPCREACGKRREPSRDREHRLVRELVENRVDDPVRRPVLPQHDHVEVGAGVVERVLTAA